MDLITALLVLLGSGSAEARELVHPTPAPYVMPKGSVQTVPDPLPYVIDVRTWGPGL